MLRFGLLPMAVALALGALGGLGSFTFGYGQGFSYFQDDPTACINCHVMEEQYDSWQNSSHHHVAVCNDCHLSHHPVGRWVTKADNGFFHSLAFTTGDFEDQIRIKPRNRRVTNQSCLACHQEVVHQMLPPRQSNEPLDCTHCHQDVGHAGK